MKNDDRAAPSEAIYYRKTFFGCQFAVVVAGYDVPHYDFIALPQKAKLLHRDTSVWRTKQIAAYVLICLFDIVDIFGSRSTEAFEMVHRMIARTMPLIDHKTKRFGVLSHVIAYAKEGSLDAVFIEYIQYLGCNIGARSVVEREIYLLGFIVDTPNGRHKPLQKSRC